MMSDAQLDTLLKMFEARAQKINLEYIQRMAWHLRKVGKLGATDIHRLSIMRQMDADMDKVQQMLARMADLMAEDIEKMFTEIAKQDWQFAQETMKKRGTPPEENEQLKAAVNAQYITTLGAMRNLSRTTVSQESYQRVIDKAIQAVQGGGTDYASAIRSALKEAAAEGVRIEYSDAAPYSKRIRYASGRTQRLDSAVRQNILDGVRELHQEVMTEAGRAFGSDGVEITAHALCAPDHLPYQGRQYSNERFAQIQDGLKRRIGQWNCRHIQFPILLGITEPVYSEERLQEIADYSNEKIEINGVVRTRYQWTQQQRALERAVRAQKDIAVAGKAAGDMKLRREAQARINALTKAYDEIVTKAGVAAYEEGMRVEGFRAVSAKPSKNTPDKERFKEATFGSETSFKRHVSKHMREYGDIGENQYLEMARELLRAEENDDIMKLTRADGSVSKYRISTNDFVASDDKWGIRTFFKPKNGIEYWREEVERNKQHD